MHQRAITLSSKHQAMRIKANIISHLRLLFSLFLMVTVWSCNKMPYYAQYSNLEQQTWDSRDTLLFELHDADTTALQHLSLGVRVTEDYHYRKLTLGIDVYDNGKRLSHDVVPFELFTKKGERNGDGVVYTEAEHDVRPLSIQKGHTYRFKVYHIMRLDPLHGVSNVFIQISDEREE